MEKRFVDLHHFRHHHEGEITHVLEVWDNEHVIMADAVSPSTTYLIGPAVDRLYDYEELGYTPKELRDIISKYESYKRLAESPNGLTVERTPVEWERFVKHAIDRAATEKNVSVCVFFRKGDVSVNVYPFPEEELDDNT